MAKQVIVGKRYRRTPTVVEAIQYTPPYGNHKEGSIHGHGNINELQAWGVQIEPSGAWGTNYDIRVYNASHDDWNLAHPHDWIIKGMDGEFYPCAPDIFEATYEEVG